MELPYKGVSVGQYSYIDAPDIPNHDEIAIARSDDHKQWRYAPDHRGKTVFNTENQASYPVNFLGEIKTSFTLLAPSTQLNKWDGKNG